MTNNLTPNVRFKGFSDDWEQRKLGNIYEISSASRVHKNEWKKSGVRFFRSSDVISIFKGQKNTPAYIDEKLYKKLSESGGIPQKGDIFITGGGSIGVPYIIGPIWPVYFKDADLLWLKKSDILGSYFLYTFLQTSMFTNYLKRISHIGTIAHYTIEQAKKTPIKIPSKLEQQKIEKLISTLTSTIASNQKKVDQLKQLKKLLLQDIFDQEWRFDGFTNPWEQRKLKEIITIIGGGTPKSSKSEFWDGEIVWFTPTEIGKKKYVTDSIRKITRDGLKYSSAKLLPKGTILFTSRASIGDVAITKTVSTTNQGFQSWIPEDGNSEFFYYLAQNIKPIALRLSSGSTFREISSSNIKNISTKIPSSKIEEKKIGELLGGIDTAIASNQKKLDGLKELKKWLLQNLFV